jgi:hypothetical protein
MNGGDLHNAIGSPLAGSSLTPGLGLTDRERVKICVDVADGLLFWFVLRAAGYSSCNVPSESSRGFENLKHIPDRQSRHAGTCLQVITIHVSASSCSSWLIGWRFHTMMQSQSLRRSFLRHPAAQRREACKHPAEYSGTSTCANHVLATSIFEITSYYCHSRWRWHRDNALCCRPRLMGHASLPPAWEALDCLSCTTA